MFHTLACAVSNVIFWMELLIPKKYAEEYRAVSREFDDCDFQMAPKTCALLLRATKRPFEGVFRLVLALVLAFCLCVCACL